MIDKTLLDEIIIGRVEPHIYAFATNTIPDYLKVGDTYRPVSVRLKEWQEHFPNLVKKFEGEAKINDVYFRDFSIHQFLEIERHKSRLQLADLPEGVYYSKEFFKEATVADVKDAITDIRNDYQNKTQKYQFYSVETLRPEETVFPRTETYPMRPNQEKTVEAFRKAIDDGRKNLLMYAVMRFGKSFTSMCCAVEMNAKLVVVVSAKADVLYEWKKTVESHVKFDGYEFVTAKTLSANNHTITERLSAGKKVVVFLTLQDLQGPDIKDKHQEVFGQDIDLLLVDETHFGARAEKYGEVLKTAKNYENDVKNKKDADDYVDVDEADKTIKTLKTNVTIHLSGTPYRILMGSEFKKEDIIAFYQFTDIVDDQKEWDKHHVLDDEYKEWDNPYYGFPQMVRFAFRPNESSRKRLEELKNSGTTYAFSALFKPQSIKKVNDGSHKKFIYEREILDLLEVIDGSKTDDELLGFLDYDKLKEGKMCRHIVIVLPYCASCDALEELIKRNKDNFRNLGGYEIVNISGVDNPNAYKAPKDIKTAITTHEQNGKKTITLTVNRMLTGSTVPEWDTMLYLKDTASPQEYDQAVFRLQNQYVRTYKDKDGNTIKYNMKPQTLLVDFDPQRMFVMQEQKSQVYVLNVGESGNAKARERLEEELRISPIITLNKDKMVQVVPTDIMQAVSQYSANKGVADEVQEIPVDLTLLYIAEIRRVIEQENELGDKAGLTINAHKGEETDLDTDGGDTGNTPTDRDGDSTGTTSGDTTNGDEETEDKKDPVKQFRTYYSRILFFAFLTKNTVGSLSEIVACIDEPENTRIANNLGISKDVLQAMQKMYWGALQKLDYKIQNINKLSHDESVEPVQRCTVAINKFGKLGVSEVITPDNICKDMVDLIPDDSLKAIIDGNNKLLDIASKAGEFAIALCRKLKTLGYDIPTIKDSIYSIPTSSITYEFTRKIYEVLGLNVENIAEQFNAYDLLEVKAENGEIDYEKVCGILTQKKDFNKITLNDEISEGEEKVKFEAVVGNPPYQEIISTAEGNKSLGKQLFPSFIKLSAKVCGRYLSFITPSKWFTSDAQDGSFITLRAWAKNNNHFSSITNIPDGKKVFEGPEIGAVNYFLYDKNHIGDTQFIDTRKSGKRPLFEEGVDIILSMNEMVDILNKVKEINFVSLMSQTKGRDAFNVVGKKEWVNKNTSKEPFSGAVEVRCAHEEIRFIKREKITKNIDLIDKWKIFTSKGNGGAGLLNREKAVAIIGKAYIGKPNSICTDSLIPIGCFSTEIEAINLQKYMTTKFLRFMVGILKVSQNIYQNVYQFVPLQDFTENSDIDWTKSIPEIDQQLYAKYGLTEEEITFIETMIKPME